MSLNKELSTTQDHLTEVLKFLEKRFPKFKVVSKEDLFVFKLFGLFNPEFLRTGAITIGSTVAIGSRTASSWKSPDEVARRLGACTLAHEGMHLADQEQEGPLMFYLKYLYPQCLALLSLITVPLLFVSLWAALPFLGFLVFLGPWSARFRLWYELRGFAVQKDLASKWLPTFYFERINYNIAQVLVGDAYYRMAKDKMATILRLDTHIANRTGPFQSQYVRDLYEQLVWKGYLNEVN